MEPKRRAEITVRVDDVRDRRAFIRHSFVSKLLLLHWAGAPWNHKNPDAHLHALQVECVAHMERERIIQGGSGLGKALALDTPIATPQGWSTMGALRVGDSVFDNCGVPCRVIAKSPVHRERTYRVSFDGGEQIVAGENHEWFTMPSNYRKALGRREHDIDTQHRVHPGVVTTAEIARTLRDHRIGVNHAIPVCGPLRTKPAALPIDPYLVGVWLGDGHSRGAMITTADSEIVQAFTDAGFTIKSADGHYAYRIANGGLQRGPDGRRARAPVDSFLGVLRALDLIRNKHVPATYLRASRVQRLALVQGLMDTDGWVQKTGTCQFTNTNERLIDAMQELLTSLGIKSRRTEKIAKLYGREIGPCWNVTFTTTEPVFRLKRKAARLPTTIRRTQGYHYIVACEETDPVDLQCIEVDSPSHLYLAGEAMIPTHNSVLGGGDALLAAMLPFRKVAVMAGLYAHVGKEWQYIDRGLRRLFAGRPQAFKSIRYNDSKTYYAFDFEAIWSTTGVGLSVENADGAIALGDEYTDIILGEGSHVSVDVFQKRILRASDRSMSKRKHGGQDFVGRISAYTTPKGYEGCTSEEWDRVMRETRHDPAQLEYGRVAYARTVWLREADVRENPDYNEETFEARRGTISNNAFMEQYLGKRSYAEGLVLSGFNRERHIVPLPARAAIKKMRLGIGIDTGALTGVVLGGLDPDLKKWVLGESYTERMTIFQALDYAEEMLVSVLGPVFDTEDPKVLIAHCDLHVIDPASQHKLEIGERWDVALVSPPPDQKTLVSTLGQMNQWMLDDEFRVAEHCDTFLDQLNKYVWKTMKAVGSKASAAPVIREPKKVYDHLIDAGRFLFLCLVEAGPLVEERDPVTWAEEWEREQRDRFWKPLQEQIELANRLGGVEV
jgi:hypothetical protein